MHRYQAASKEVKLETGFLSYSSGPNSVYVGNGYIFN